MFLLLSLSHLYRAFWGYHSHYPAAADRLFNTFDSQVQKHLRDEKRQLDGEPPAPPVQLSQIKLVDSIYCLVSTVHC